MDFLVDEDMKVRSDGALWPLHYACRIMAARKRHAMGCPLSSTYFPLPDQCMCLPRLRATKPKVWLLEMNAGPLLKEGQRGILEQMCEIAIERTELSESNHWVS